LNETEKKKEAFFPPVKRLINRFQRNLSFSRCYLKKNQID